jgi:hypothetical protein
MGSRVRIGVMAMALVALVGAAGWWTVRPAPDDAGRQDVAAQARTVVSPASPAAPPARPIAGRGTPVVVPTSGWTPDQGSMMASLDGVELAIEGRCVFGRHFYHGEQRTGIVWPKGWSAQIAADGRVEVLDAGRRVMVREGDTFGGGGGFVNDPPAAAASTCRPKITQVWHVQGGFHSTPG